MKNLMFVCFVLASGGCDAQITAAENAQPVKAQEVLEIYIEGLRGSEGNVVLALYSDKQAFELAGEPIAWISVPAKTKKIILAEFPESRIAISAFHDTNRNGKFDAKGEIPLEGWGNSGDIGIWTEPTFEAALTARGLVTVDMHYYN